MSNTAAPFEAYRGSEPYIFVSYSHSDSAAVYEHLEKLRGTGFRIWYDGGIAPGDEWPEETARASIDAACCLVFMSPEAAALREVRNEINLALTKQKPVLCVYVRQTDLPMGLQLQLGNMPAILEHRFENKDKFYERLIEMLPVNTQEAEQ
jgi:hypothetical protein